MKREPMVVSWTASTKGKSSDCRKVPALRERNLAGFKVTVKLNPNFADYPSKISVIC